MAAICLCPAVSSGAEITITCKPTLAGTAWAVDDFWVDVQATSFSGSAELKCEDTKTNTHKVHVNQKPEVSLAADTAKTVCANNGLISLGYIPSAKAKGVDVPWTIKFTDVPEGVKCQELSSTAGK